jgi:hypothetical protein
MHARSQAFHRAEREKKTLNNNKKLYYELLREMHTHGGGAGMKK